MRQDIDKFIHDQLSVWPEAAATYRSLKSVRSRSLDVNGLRCCLQYNPGRVASVEADTRPEVLAHRACFLCKAARPPEQKGIKFDGRKGRKYEILINRFPIFPQHLLIVRDEHEPQSIWHRYVDMLDLARELDDYAVFYNGPASGASAPEHLHFQACAKGALPLQQELDRVLGRIAAEQPDRGGEDDVVYISSVQDAQLFHYKHFTRGCFALRARTPKSMAKLFYRTLDCTPLEEGENEPRFNVVTWYADGEYRAALLCRAQIRSHHYFAEGAEHLTISPASVEMAGCFIVPYEADYERITPEMLGEILAEVSVSEQVEREIIARLTRTQPKIEVGILSAPEIVFEIISDGAGPQKVSYREGKIDYNGSLYDELCFEAVTLSTLFAEPSFILYDVVIGIHFHWERKIDQRFAGTLKFIVEDGRVTAVNVIGVEDYLLSVISSEMKSSASLAFLKAHAVISRSWVMAQIAAKQARKQTLRFAAEDLPQLCTYVDGELHKGEATLEDPFVGGRPPRDDSAMPCRTERIPRRVEWFGHSDHKHFDVCADDHCQRYQGLTMTVGETVRKAIDQTWGQVMTCGGDIVDARFHKACGGALERFSTCWEDKDPPYLVGKPDAAGGTLPDLTDEAEARRWICGPSPEAEQAFCHDADAAILSQVLNDYDLETPDFFRWRVEYTVEAASELFARRSGRDLGTLTALIPLERGVSGRIKLLRVVGTKGCWDIGKELLIRRYLSETHLKSSAFVAEFKDGKLILSGAGWGHGVGLCQIGAAVMAARGYDYRQILQHYYPGHQTVLWKA